MREFVTQMVWYGMQAQESLDVNLQNVYNRGMNAVQEAYSYLRVKPQLERYWLRDAERLCLLERRVWSAHHVDEKKRVLLTVKERDDITGLVHHYRKGVPRPELLTSRLVSPQYTARLIVLDCLFKEVCDWLLLSINLMEEPPRRNRVSRLKPSSRSPPQSLPPPASSSPSSEPHTPPDKGFSIDKEGSEWPIE